MCSEYEQEQIATLRGAVSEETAGEDPQNGYEVAIFGFGEYDSLPLTLRYEDAGQTYAWKLWRVDIRTTRYGGLDYTCVYRLLKYRSL